MGALAFYFFSLYQLEEFPFPNFLRKEDWYDIPLLVRKADIFSAKNSYHLSDNHSNDDYSWASKLQSIGRSGQYNGM